MRPTILLAAIFFLSSIAPNASAETSHLWSQSFGDVQSDYATDVVVDPITQDVIMGGYFAGSVGFGGATFSSAGNTDIVLAKYSRAGVHLWSRSFGGVGIDDSVELAVDAVGNVFMLARFSGTVDFGGGNLVSAGGVDLVLAKYSPAGGHLWSQRFGSANSDTPRNLAVDTAGNVHITGYFLGSIDFGGGLLFSAGAEDVFLASFDSNGTHLSSDRFGDGLGDFGSDVAVDVSGNVHLLGEFNGSINLGGTIYFSAGGKDIFLAKFDPAGTHLWSAKFGDASTDNANALEVDRTGNVFMAGHFAGTLSLGGATLTSAGVFDAFLAKFRSDGNHEWSSRFGGISNEFAPVLAVNEDGVSFLSGNFGDTVDFGGGPLTSQAFNDIYIASYDAVGAHRWSRSFEGGLFDNPFGIDLDADESVVLAGYFQSSVDFGGGFLSSQGETDMVLAKYAQRPEEPSITSIADVGNDQGRKVRIRFDRAGVDDADAAQPIQNYHAFRRDDPTPGADSSKIAGWTEVGSISAFGETSYGIDVPTVADSTVSQGEYLSVFFVRAATSVPSRFYDSAPDSGYSLDNLAPGVPQGLMLANDLLEWSESNDADFDYFTIYGAADSEFEGATPIGGTIGTSFDVSGQPYVFYFVTAIDFAGNESLPATLDAHTGIGGAPERHALGLSNHPNPFNPATTVRYVVPASGPVTLTVHDVAGRRVATLLERVPHTPGIHRVTWSGTTDRGSAAASGIYYLRLVQGEESRSTKITLLK